MCGMELQNTYSLQSYLYGTTGKLVEQTLIKIMKEFGKSTVVKLNV